MKMSGGPASLNIKLLLLAIALTIASGTVFYTQNLVKRLQDREKQIVQLYASSFKYIVDTDVIDTDLTFIFENIIQRIDFPLILTDNNNKVSLSKMGRGIKNLDIDSSFTEKQREKFLNEKIIELSEINDPIVITYGDSIVLAKIYYGDSDIIQRLRYYPYFQIVFAVLFIIIAYVSFSYLKKTEQSNIWVGMSKETAHQLGTPISSLMGWTEILRLNYKNPDKVIDTAEEIESDLTRLNKIAKRFSKIGSKPELNEENVYDVISRVINYFQRRLPQTSKNVSITLDGSSTVKSNLNSELFEWVIENLIKNALDAFERGDGKIEMQIFEKDNLIEIEISDNGKGIEYKRRKDIFRPGYSTKRRGWGLGLSLSKRIIEDYHKGKIFISHSVIDEGTTFKIILNKS